MSAHVRAPLERALLVWLAAVIALGSGWLTAVAAVSSAARMVTVIGGGALVLLLSVAVAAAAYFAGKADQMLQRTVRAETGAARLNELAETVLPAVADRAKDGVAPEQLLAEVPHIKDPAVGRMLTVFATGLAEAERRAADARQARLAVEYQAAQLADSSVPALIGRIRHDRTAAESALAAAEMPSNGALVRLLRVVAREVAASERASAAALAACASAAARVQAQTGSMLAELRELENRHSENEVFGDLLALDHQVSQLGRLADSIALLSGGRSGRRWTKPIPMESILRGAMGRIGDYRRVQLHATSTAAVAGFAAEGVMHALAELMENATAFSAHGTMAHVYVEEEDAGVVVTIEDGGLGMRKRERDRAERLVTQQLDLTSLPGTRLGLAVVGRLSGRYGLTVSFRPSSRGGTGVVVMIPRTLITRPQAEPPGHHDEAGTARSATSSAATSPVTSPVTSAVAAGAGAVSPDAVPGPAAEAEPPAARPAGPAQSASDPAAESGQDDAETGTVLPRRRRGETLAAASRSLPAVVEQTGPQRSEAGARLAAFRQAAGGHHRQDTSQDEDSTPDN
ncbi:ATP-binding protein [Spirillospora sp. NPDC047279]|uniref:sensor histidine kinase n=1 Tax=Spirillospora sp. NPDC047279 TaxID=3155478 RepID=UPI0033EBA01E